MKSKTTDKHLLRAYGAGRLDRKDRSLLLTVPILRMSYNRGWIDSMEKKHFSEKETLKRLKDEYENAKQEKARKKPKAQKRLFHWWDRGFGV